MQQSQLLNLYKSNNNSEFEYRFTITNKNVFSKLINSVEGLKTIEQTINFISIGKGVNRICQLHFVDGKQKQKTYMSKKRLKWLTFHNKLLPYKITVSEEKTIPKFSINIAKMARIKLRLSVRPLNLPGWRVDFTLTKTVNDIKKDIRHYKNKILFPISVDNFIENAPWEHADAFELEVEHIDTGNKNIKKEDLVNVPKFIFNLIDTNYTDRFEYRSLLQNVATYILNRSKLGYFNKKGSIRNLYNKVWELNRQAYYREIFLKLRDYYLLDKADGVRTLLMIRGNKLLALNGGLKTYELKKTYKKDTIFDAEHIEYKGKNIYYVFDVIAYNDENLTNTPTSNRIKYIPKIVEMAEGNVVSKNIVSLTDNYRNEIKKVWDNSLSSDKYEVDGLIFTPKNGLYQTMKSRKWKPLTHMSIDFIIKEVPKNLLGVHPYIKRKGYTMLFLFCGISKRDYDKLRLTLLMGYNKIFPGQQMYNIFPIQFSPSNDPFAYIYYHPDSSKFKVSDIINNVCEFRRIKLDTKNPEWDLMRVRHDRKLDVEKGGYFGNSYFVAEFTWQNYETPLKFEDLVVSNTEFMDIGYFKEEKSLIYKSGTSFNRFVVESLLKEYSNSNWLVDLAAGRGADMFRVSKANIKNALFMDIDAHALSELVSRKHDFQRGVKRLNTKVYTKVMDLTTDHKIVLQSIKNIGVPLGYVDVIMCNFAIHYIIRTPAYITNLINVIKTILKPGGHFFFTCFDGEKIFKLLEPTGRWDIREGEVLKYSMKKKYKSKRFEPTGQQIDYLPPFSGGKYYTEYLVNFKYLLKEFTKNGFVVEKTNGFGSLLPMFKKENFRVYDNITEDDKKFLSLYSYAVLRKKNTSAKQKKVEEKEIEDSLVIDRTESASVYSIELDDKQFSKIVDKTLDLFVKEGQFSIMKKGDLLSWDNKNDSVDGVIERIVSYKNLEEALKSKLVKDNIKDFTKEYPAKYSKLKKAKKSIVAIKFKIIE